MDLDREPDESSPCEDQGGHPLPSRFQEALNRGKMANARLNAQQLDRVSNTRCCEEARRIRDLRHPHLLVLELLPSYTAGAPRSWLPRDLWHAIVGCLAVSAGAGEGASQMM